ncbi:hypothetical protein [Streptomyces zhihengii]|uniref:hypothetical protein n=1 Tax=Streptomyces zhihengii TaxID=1818004 RepID=UPI0033AAF666
MFVPSVNGTSSSRRRSTAFGAASLVGTEVNWPVKPVANSARFPPADAKSIIARR